MNGVNKVILIGRLGADPEIRHTASNVPVATISVATSEKWKDKNTGEKQERTEWHRVVAWQRLAEIIQQYVHKGDAIYVEGKLQTKKWQDQSGADRYTTEIVANQMQMLGGQDHAQQNQRQPPSHAGQAPGAGQQNAQANMNVQQPANARPDFDDDVPF